MKKELKRNWKIEIEMRDLYTSFNSTLLDTLKHLIWLLFSCSFVYIGIIIITTTTTTKILKLLVQLSAQIERNTLWRLKKVKKK